jgi:hypothetical protein
VSFVTAWQTVPLFGQSFTGAVQAPVVLASQRQIARQVFVPDIWLQMRPGMQSAAVLHASPSVLVRVVSGQAQSTWSIAPGVTHARPTAHPPRFDAAAARGSQLNVQVWYAVKKVGHMTGPSQKLPGPPPPAPNAAQSAFVLQYRRQSFTLQAVFVGVA